MKTIIAFALCLFLSLAAAAQDIKGTFAIKNVEIGLLLRIKDANGADGTPLVSYTPVNWKCMTWDFQSQGGNVYQLKNLFTGKTFEPIGKSASEGTALHQQKFQAGAANQEYEFIPVEKNVYCIRLKGTELYLSPSENGEVNSAVVLSKKTDSKRQQWTLYEQHPTM